MSLFLDLLDKLLPLYATMGVGFLLGRRFRGMGQTLAQLQIYFLIPVVLFFSIVKLPFSTDVFFLPVLRFGISLAFSTSAYFVARRFWTPYAPLLAQTAGCSNIGYFGVPVAAALFPPEMVAVYIVAVVGGQLHEYSFGFFWMARGKHAPRDAVRRLLQTPLLYVVILGMACSAWGLKIPPVWDKFSHDFTGAYIILGALIIGIGIAQQDKLRFNIKFNVVTTVLKFMLSPAFTLLLLHLLRATPLAVPMKYEPILILMSFMPMGANTAVLASLLDFHADEASTAVAVSTLLSIFLIPLFVLWFGMAHV
ncbi:MAG: AEC family transporter [Bdellovibrionales bacterium]